MGSRRSIIKAISGSVAVALLLLALSIFSKTSPADLLPRPRLQGEDDDLGIACEKIGSQTEDATKCDFVKDFCSGVPELFDYLQLRYCDLGGNVGTIIFAYIILFAWLVVVISLLATTADNFFVPSLKLLAGYLKLSPPVAGITLLAIGNGAPDVFTAIAGLAADDFPLVLGALIGASMCISSGVLGAVLLVGPVTVDHRTFIRDISVYLIATITIVCTAADGKIYIYESSLFLILYVSYVLLVVFLERWKRSKKDERTDALISDSGLSSTPSQPQSINGSSSPKGGSDSRRSLGPSSSNVALQDITPSKREEDQEDLPPEHLSGLTWPKDDGLWQKIQYCFEFPFSCMRWISSPPTDGKWCKERRFFAVIMPTFLGYLLLLMNTNFDGFSMSLGSLPMSAFIPIIGIPLSIFIFFTTNNEHVPSYYPVLVFISFISSIAWLNIIANECVALLQSLGIIWNISSALLGLTVLAIGNSVGDFVADTAVARAGQPECGVASCFGSPLLNDVVGLGISLTITCAGSYPDPFSFSLNTQVYLGWGFLGTSLLSSLLIFPLSKFQPPRLFGWYLAILYIVFLITTVVVETAF